MDLEPQVNVALRGGEAVAASTFVASSEAVPRHELSVARGAALLDSDSFATTARPFRQGMPTELCSIEFIRLLAANLLPVAPTAFWRAALFLHRLDRRCSSGCKYKSSTWMARRVTTTAQPVLLSDELRPSQM